MRMLHALASLSVLATAATAQTTIVSPVAAATVEGNSNNVFPFAQALSRRYQQAHGDVGGSPKLIRKLALRMNASTVNHTGVAALDMELLLGHTRPIAQMSFTFAQNYVGAPTTAIARKNINFGPQGQAVTPCPNPFTSNMDLVLDTPFPYTGAVPLLWEAVIYSNTITGSFSALDADSTNFNFGVSTITGSGCVATGRPVAMTHTAAFNDAQGILLVNFTVTNGPSSAATLVSVGTTNPNLTIPGLCSNLYTNVIALIPLGVTDAAGAISIANPTGRTFLISPNTLTGALIMTQVHCLDLARPDPIGVSNSNGRSMTVPMSNATKYVDVMRLANSAGGTAAAEGSFFGASNIGFGLVTQFTY